MSMVSELLEKCIYLGSQKSLAKDISKKLFDSVKRYESSKDNLAAKEIAEFTVKRREISKLTAALERDISILAAEIKKNGIEACIK